MTLETPKQRFLKVTGKVGKFQELVDSERFKEAIDIALLQYQHMLTAGPGNEVNSAMASYFCLRGAQQFVDVLKTLGDDVVMTPRIVSHNLNHE
jgi:hypothetical protein